MLTVNFTELWEPNEQPSDPITPYFVPLLVYLALTDDLEDVLASTVATPLLPGTHLVGIPGYTVRQRLQVEHLSTLGLLNVSLLNQRFSLNLTEQIPKKYRTYVVAKMTLLPDPLAAVSPDFPAGPSISTLRIVSAGFYEDWTISQDYRTKTTLGGFAEVGGLGSFLSIIFVVLFGNTLLGIAHRTSSTLIRTRLRVLRTN